MTSMKKEQPSAVSGKEERKLKPIFDLVDEGNYKQAIAQLDKFLKRSNSTSNQSIAAVHQAKALKCLCLWRLPGRQVDAGHQADELIEESPDDEGTLSVFSLCLRDMQRNSDIEQLYSKAVDKNPKNEDLLNCLIMAHVRCDNFKMQQVRSLQLNKLVSSPKFPNTTKPYYFWAVMAVFLQGRSNPDIASKVQLPLARKMMEKSVADSLLGTTKYEQIDLLLMILEQQKDYTSAYEIFNKNIAVYDKELPVLRDRRRVEYLVGMQSFDKAIQICKEVVLSTGDAADWFFFDNLITCTITSVSGNSESSAADTSSVISELVSFLTEEKASHARCIGHHYALLHLRKLLEERGFDCNDSGLASMTSLVLAFYQSFGHKSPFFNYVRPCLTIAICETLVNDTTSKMSKLETGSGDDLPVSLDDMYSLMAVCEVERLTVRYKQNLTEQQCVARCETLTRLYRKYLPLGNDLQSTEPQFSSKFIILAAHYCVDAYMLSECRDQKYLWTALDKLREAAEASFMDSQLLMVMTRIYQHMGLVLTCTELLDRMQIKQFLLQTTSWVLFNRLSSCGARQQCRMLNSSLIKYIQSSTQSIPDFVIQAYRSGVYRKIVDMIQWKESLLKSFAFIKCVVEEVMLDIIQLDKEHSPESRTEEMFEFLGDYNEVMQDWNQWVDDRDFDVSYNWEAPDTNWAGEEAKKLSYNLELCWLKMRYTLASCLCYLICSVTNPTKHFKCDLSKVSTDFQAAIQESSKVFSALEEHKLARDLCGHPFSPFSNQLSLFFKLRLDEFYAELVKSLEALTENCTMNGGKTSSKVVKLADIPDPIQKFVQQISDDSFLLENSQIKSEHLQKLQLITEALAIYVLSIGLLCRKLAKKNAGKKRTDEPTLEFPGLDAFKSLLESLCDNVTKLTERIDKTDSEIGTCGVDVEIVKKNLSCILTQIKQLCVTKFDYLKSFNL